MLCSEITAQKVRGCRRLLLSLNYNVVGTYTYLLFFRWHRLGISVKGNSITAIVDCKKQQSREIARVPEDTIATDGIVLLGQEIEDNTFFPGWYLNGAF